MDRIETIIFDTLKGLFTSHSYHEFLIVRAALCSRVDPEYLNPSVIFSSTLPIVKFMDKSLTALTMISSLSPEGVEVVLTAWFAYTDDCGKDIPLDGVSYDDYCIVKHVANQCVQRVYEDVCSLGECVRTPLVGMIDVVLKTNRSLKPDLTMLKFRKKTGLGLLGLEYLMEFLTLWYTVASGDVHTTRGAALVQCFYDHLRLYEGRVIESLDVQGSEDSGG